MFTVPGADAVALPDDVTLAMLESDELHWTELLTSLVVPSDMWAVAVNCCDAPVPMDIELGATCIEEIVGLEVLLLDCEPPPEQPVNVAKTRNRPAHNAFFITISSPFFAAGITPGGYLE
jgi:hypothetical protein